MGRQALGAKWLRRIARTTGLDVRHGSANGGYVHAFTTADHRHGEIDIRTMEWSLLKECPRFTSCRKLFPSECEKGES